MAYYIWFTLKYVLPAEEVLEQEKNLFAWIVASIYQEQNFIHIKTILLNRFFGADSHFSGYHLISILRK